MPEYIKACLINALYRLQHNLEEDAHYAEVFENVEQLQQIRQQQQEVMAEIKRIEAS